VWRRPAGTAAAFHHGGLDRGASPTAMGTQICQ
jgi:hypothetical protein